MILFLFVFWPLLGGCRFAAANLGPPVAESTLYFSRSEKVRRPPNLREKKSQQQADKGAGGQQATITRKQAVACGRQAADRQWNRQQEIPFLHPRFHRLRAAVYI